MNLATEAAILFGASFALAVGFGYAVTRLRKPRFALVEGTPVRLACPKGSMRSRIVKSVRGGFLMDAPLFRDAFVPLRPGESLKYEIVTVGGVWTGLLQVIRRDAESKQVEVKLLGEPRRSDRRSECRSEANRPCRLDGAEAKLMDISKGGARVHCPNGVPEPGEKVRVDDGLAYVVSVDRSTNMAHLMWTTNA